MGLGELQPIHLIVILVIVLVIFGPGKLPQLGKAVGDGMRELKKASGQDGAREGLGAASAATTMPHAGSTTATVTPITSASRTCPSCEANVLGTDKFCGNCGSQMEQVPRSVDRPITTSVTLAH